MKIYDKAWLQNRSPSLKKANIATNIGCKVHHPYEVKH